MTPAGQARLASGGRAAAATVISQLRRWPARTGAATSPAPSPANAKHPKLQPRV